MAGPRGTLLDDADVQIIVSTHMSTCSHPWELWLLKVASILFTHPRVLVMVVLGRVMTSPWWLASRRGREDSRAAPVSLDLMALFISPKTYTPGVQPHDLTPHNILLNSEQH